MERRHMSDKQFETLYSRYLPRLYSAALCLTGCQAVAERITSRAFLETIQVESYAADERRFAVESAKRLYILSSRERQEDYNLPREFQFLEGALPTPFCDMSPAKQAMIVFGVLLDFPENDLSYILHIRRPTTKLFRNAG